MARIVMKFGGTSVADIERIENVAAHVEREALNGHEIVIVVSAMAGRTNALVEWTGALAGSPDNPEYDTVLASGEQVTAGLLALALQKKGLNARSWLGWQIPLQTDETYGSARITQIEATQIIANFAQKQIAVVAGFQGINANGRITTLGRGGSDTSAVAMAAAIKADRCDIYTDVDGVYTTDPRVEPKASRLPKISFEEMLEMASLGAKVLQVRSVELAMMHKVRTYIRSSFVPAELPNPEGLEQQDDKKALLTSGTLICDEDEIVEQQIVTGITFTQNEAQISLRRLADRPGVSAAIFVPLAEKNVNIDMIVQNISEDGSTTDMTFTVPVGDRDKAVRALEEHREHLQFDTLQSEGEFSKVSIIGIGMRSHAGVAATAFKALALKGINIRAITTSEIKISLLIDSAYAELAVRTLHDEYGLAYKI